MIATNSSRVTRNAEISVDKQQQIISNAFFGTSVFVIVELMYFTSLISAFVVVRAGIGDAWVPPYNIRLPFVLTSINTLLLFLSGISLFLCSLQLKKNNWHGVKFFLLGSILLGSCFLVVQGVEWVQLIKLGMTMTSSVFGAMFFLLLGSHAIHVLGGVVALLLGFYWFQTGRLSVPRLNSLQLYWYLVVTVWPILYALVYFKW